MGRLCERPGCSAPAEVLYAIDAEHLTVWIEVFDGNVAFRAGVLCRRHADAMVVPMGWTLDDRREAAPRLFKPRTPETAPAARPKRARSAPAASRSEQLQLADTGPLATRKRPKTTRPKPAATGEHDELSPWKPVFDQSDDLDGLLASDSPLLSRAFGKRSRST